jgi:hypothetical protein
MKVVFENLYNCQFLRLGVSSDVMPCSLIEVYQVFKDCCLCCDYQTTRHQVPEGTSFQFTLSFIEQLKALLFLST